MSGQEPASQTDLRALLLDYLDHYRTTIIGMVETLPTDQATTSLLPSGWTPAQLLNHLAFMEQRWFVACFAGTPVDELWGDWDGDHWRIPQESVGSLARRLRDAGTTTRAIVEAHALTEVARHCTAKGALAPHLQWILLHVLQEYARHAGQMDIVSEIGRG